MLEHLKPFCGLKFLKSLLGGKKFQTKRNPEGKKVDRFVIFTLWTIIISNKINSLEGFHLRINPLKTLIRKASYLCCCRCPGPRPPCRFCLRTTWYCCLHTSWATGCVHRHFGDGRTWSLKKLQSFLWAELCGFQETED